MRIEKNGRAAEKNKSDGGVKRERQAVWKEEPGDRGAGFPGERMIVLPTEAFRAYVRHPQVRRLYLTDIGYFPKAARHYRERREGIEEYILLYCTEGKGTIELEGESWILEEDEAFCIPARRGHRYYADAREPWSLLWVHFQGEDTAYFPLDEGRKLRLDAARGRDRIQSLFELLFEVLEEDYTLGNFIYLSQALELLLAELYARRGPAETGIQNRHVTEAIRFMYRRLGCSLTLEEIAEQFGFSRSYLNLIFKKHTQYAPMDFFIRLKMKEACKLLRSTDLYVYEVAQRLGYKDPYYFSRIFAKIVGSSPRAYREGARVSTSGPAEDHC